MAMRSRLIVLAMGCFLVAAGRVRADDAPKPDLKPFLEEVRKLVEKHYSKAKVTLKDQTIHFEFNTRKFMIHELNRIGDQWQDAGEQPGPQPGGIHCDIELRQGKYDGAAVVPGTHDVRYFTLLQMAPYSKKIDHYLYVNLKYPRNVPKEFLKEFDQLLDGFDKHVLAKGK